MAGTDHAAAVAAYLHQHETKGLLRFITCGSVDDGKSTLIGRLLHDTQLLLDDQLAALQKDSLRHGTQNGEMDFALLVDGLAAEREQGITIDVAYRFFSTDKRKSRWCWWMRARACSPRPAGTATSSRCWASATWCWR
jgi:bifunctional enzyme CysN/CysC